MTGNYCQGGRTRAGGNVSNPRNSPDDKMLSEVLSEFRVHVGTDSN